MFGNPKYPPGFQHFDYVNTNAPQGGTLALSVMVSNSSFDKFNPYSLKGRPAPGVTDLVFETLTVLSLDEPNTQYGLLAKSIELATDNRSVRFVLHPQIRFSDGQKLTALDVLNAFKVLTSKKASPRFRTYFAEISTVKVIDELTVEFQFTRPGRDLAFVAGSLPVFSPKWGSLKGIPSFEQLSFEPPIGTGPYVLDRYRQGDHVTYRKNPDYWAKDVPVRKGMFNFDKVVYKLYKDRDTQVAGIRAREYNFFAETQMRYWCCQYIGKHFDSGEIAKEVVPHANPPSMNGWVMNLRREKFQDVRVRKALVYLLDFEWINDKIFDSEFKRVTSYFTGTPLAAEGLPDKAELALLEPWRQLLEPAVFGPVFELPKTKGPETYRDNLREATRLLREAGWTYKNGKLLNQKGEPFVIEIAGTRNQSPFMDPIYRNLTKAGIVVEKSLSDAATQRKRMSEFDYDISSVALRDARNPGPELWRNFNGADANRKGSENLTGVNSPAIDDLLQKLLNAESFTEQQVAAKALDRVLIHGHYFWPWRYLTNHYLIHNRNLTRPAQLPTHYGANEWVISTWWWQENDSQTTRLNTAAR
ncbi:extracellular solute-binding protein [Limnobacter thiooxidans]|uniref:Extracellular solute-binding protein n=2 Tax=Limnobacter thiooxidans TaxID=131080 RepID=A0AA86J0U0_9BURK|nr:extracellular solute-binding protein [Limnobacter thiooxidans]